MPPTLPLRGPPPAPAPALEPDTPPPLTALLALPALAPATLAAAPCAPAGGSPAPSAPHPSDRAPSSRGQAVGPCQRGENTVTIPMDDAQVAKPDTQRLEITLRRLETIADEPAAVSPASRGWRLCAASPKRASKASGLSQPLENKKKR